MIALVSAALVTLVAAIFTASIPLLLLSLAFDGMFVAYLAALNAMRHGAPSTPLPQDEPVEYGELRLVSDDDVPRAASR